MAPVSYLDTHVAAWLFAGRKSVFPAPARRHLEQSDLLISPMAVLELDYLFEIGRATERAAEVLRTLELTFGVRVCEIPFPRIALEASRLSWTRDPFDRLIVAQASVAQAPLLTRDRTIRAHYPHAVWKD